MAIGAARMFGIVLPVNFHSPYKATNIIEFWRRWHMTLSAFLRDYLYIALGGNRAGRLMRYRNLMLTMLLGGLWHGAGWTLVAWGALHGLYLSVNHAWRHTTTRLFPQGLPPSRSPRRCRGSSPSSPSSSAGCLPLRAVSMPPSACCRAWPASTASGCPTPSTARLDAVWPVLARLGFGTYLGGGAQLVFTWLSIAALLPVALILPNTQQIMRHTVPGMHLHTGRAEDELQPAPGSRTNSPGATPPAGPSASACSLPSPCSP